MNRDRARLKDIDIIFIQSHFHLGGIEVLEMKLIEQFLRFGIAVTVACRENDILKNTDGLRIFSHNGYPDLISRANQLIASNAKRVIFVSLHPSAAVAAELLARMVLRRRRETLVVHHFHWVSHSRAFFFSRSGIIRKLMRELFFILPKRSTHFMNDAALNAHQAFWRICLRGYPVLRIVGREPTTTYPSENNAEATRTCNKRAALRIVSVGRFVAFKSYNMNAAMVIRQLRDDGIDATWDIWGYGPEESAIVSTTQRYGVMDYVRLCGPLPHAMFDQTVSSYDVFVGMGTAVLEAAKTGMPVCVAVENQGDACYGHLHEAPTDSVGDRVDGFPERKLHDVLRSVAALTSQERARIGQKDNLAARLRESTLDEFADAILRAEKMTTLSIFENVVLWVGKCYLQANHLRHQKRTFPSVTRLTNIFKSRRL
jgi:hypothetical protein